MNRIVRHLVAACSVAGAVAATPAVAGAQQVDVVPPAYAPPAVPAPPVQPGVTADFRDRPAWRNDEERREWERREHERREWERREQARIAHERQCATARYYGTAPWVLWSMGCF